MDGESNLEIETLVQEAVALIEGADGLPALDDVRVRFLGKSGELTAQLKQLGKLPKEERPAAGQAINKAKQALQEKIEQRKAGLEEAALSARLASERIDVTLPGRGRDHGGLHPVTRTMERIERLFANSGFKVAEGPEIEDDFHNFE
ncbi:MAG: phenylalanine--tRNA ligase subunit alpha, partial [Candidatus Sedimenticola sp. 6PFRAG1]